MTTRAIAEPEAPTSIQTPPRFQLTGPRGVLRALALWAFTEAVFYRFAARPGHSPDVIDRKHDHASLNRAGSLTFFLAFFFVTPRL